MLHMAVVFVRLYENCGTQGNAATTRLWHLLLIRAVRHSLPCAQRFAPQYGNETKISCTPNAYVEGPDTSRPFTLPTISE